MQTRTWDHDGKGALAFTELGCGTAPLAGLYAPVPPDQAQATLARAWDLGLRYFDTAPQYGLGQAETRLGQALAGKNRADFTVSTKVGRLLRRAGKGEPHTGTGKWFDVPNRVEVYDYTYDGVMRSVEFSLERTGLDRVDILYVHDLDLFTHGTVETLAPLRQTFLDGGYRAMERLREEGVTRAIGGGMNEWQACQWLAERGDFDIFLLAGRYTLLEQEALDTFLPLCLSRGIGVVIGGPYNSGVLASGPRPGAFYNYDPAPAWVLDRVARIEAVCAAHATRLVDAAERQAAGRCRALPVRAACSGRRAGRCRNRRARPATGRPAIR